MDSVTLLSQDKKCFRISQIHAESFKLLKYSEICLDCPIPLKVQSKTLKFLLDYSEIYMSLSNVSENISLYRKKINPLCNTDRFDIIRAAFYLRYDRVNDLVSFLKS
jgi:hypothetical protein